MLSAQTHDRSPGLSRGSARLTRPRGGSMAVALHTPQPALAVGRYFCHTAAAWLSRSIHLFRHTPVQTGSETVPIQGNLRRK